MTRLLSVLALLLAVPVAAQSAVDHYHDAARLYVGGENEAAESAALAGLALEPNDAKLQALLDRIRQDEQQQSGQGGQQNQQQNENQQGGEEGQEGREGDSGGEQDQQPADEGQQPQDDGEGAPSDRPDEQQAPPQPSDGAEDGRDESGQPNAPQAGEGEPTPESQAPVAPVAMSRAEAERILNAVGADERLLLRRTQRRPGTRRRVEKDW